MNRNRLLITTALLLTVLTSGCVAKSTFEEKSQEADTLSHQLKETQMRLTALNADYNAETALKKELVATLERLEAALEAALAAEKDTAANHAMEIEALRSAMADREDSYKSLLADKELTAGDLRNKLVKLGESYEGLKKQKEAEVQKMSATYGELIKSMKGEIDKGQVTISELKGKLTVNMVDAVLFDSGKAEVKEEGLAVLQKVIDILMTVTDKAIRIEGHTDNVKIIGMLAKKYPTNWELSAARAINVSRFLQKQGLDPANLSAIAYGEYKPVAENDTAEGRAQNRRIEIILVAKE